MDKLKNIKLEHLWVITVFVTCFAYIVSTPIDQYDFWQHLKVGEIIFNSRRVLDKDIFTFTIFEKPYVDMHWGAQVFYYLVNQLGGLELLSFLHACILTATFYLLFLISYKISNNLKVSSIITVIAFILSASNFALRPQEFSILFFTLTFYLIKEKKYAFIPLVFLFWANLHGAFLVGFVLLFCNLFNNFNLREKKIINLDILSTLIMSALMTILTPHGINLFPTLLAVGPASSKITKIAEWMPPSFKEPTGIIFFTAIIALVVLQSKKRIKWETSDILCFIIFTSMALRWQRAIIWWAIITSPIFTLYLKELFKDKLKASSTQSKSESIINLIFCGLLFVYLIGSLPWLKANSPFVPEVKKNLIATNTPVELSTKLKSLSNSKRVFNNFSWGSYFIYDLRENQKIFFDPKDFLYPPKIVKDYYTISSGDTNWEKILDSYDVDTLAIGKEEQPLLIEEAKKSKKWERVYEDELGCVFIPSVDNSPTTYKS